MLNYLYLRSINMLTHPQDKIVELEFLRKQHFIYSIKDDFPEHYVLIPEFLQSCDKETFRSYISHRYDIYRFIEHFPEHAAQIITRYVEIYDDIRAPNKSSNDNKNLANGDEKLHELIFSFNPYRNIQQIITQYFLQHPSQLMRVCNAIESLSECETLSQQFPSIATMEYFVQLKSIIALEKEKAEVKLLLKTDGLYSIEWNFPDKYALIPKYLLDDRQFFADYIGRDQNYELNLIVLITSFPDDAHLLIKMYTNDGFHPLDNTKDGSKRLLKLIGYDGHYAWHQQQLSQIIIKYFDQYPEQFLCICQELVQSSDQLDQVFQLKRILEIPEAQTLLIQHTSSVGESLSLNAQYVQFLVNYCLQHIDYLTKFCENFKSRQDFDLFFHDFPGARNKIIDCLIDNYQQNTLRHLSRSEDMHQDDLPAFFTENQVKKLLAQSFQKKFIHYFYSLIKTKNTGTSKKEEINYQSNLIMQEPKTLAPIMMLSLGMPMFKGELFLEEDIFSKLNKYKFCLLSDMKKLEPDCMYFGKDKNNNIVYQTYLTSGPTKLRIDEDIYAVLKIEDPVVIRKIKLAISNMIERQFNWPEDIKDNAVSVVSLTLFQCFHLFDAPTLFPFLRHYPRLTEMYVWNVFYILTIKMSYLDYTLYEARTRHLSPFDPAVIILFNLVVEYAPHRIIEATIMKYLLTDISLTKLADYIEKNKNNVDQFFQAHPAFYTLFLERVGANLLDQFPASLDKTFDLHPYYKTCLTYILKRTIDPLYVVLEKKHFSLPIEMIVEIASFILELPFRLPVYDLPLTRLTYKACLELEKERSRKKLEKLVPSARLLTQQHRFFNSICVTTHENKTPEQQEAFDQRWGLVPFQK